MKDSLRRALAAAAALSLSACAGTDVLEHGRTPAVRQGQALTDTGFDHMLDKDYAGAKPYFERALTVEPNLAMAHLDLGAVYQNTGSPEAARKQFDLAIANDTPANDYPPVRVTTDGSSGTVSEIAARNLAHLPQATAAR